RVAGDHAAGAALRDPVVEGQRVRGEALRAHRAPPSEGRTPAGPCASSRRRGGRSTANRVARTITAVTVAAAVATTGDEGASVARPTAIQSRPQTTAAGAATGRRPARVSATPTTATASSTITARTSGAPKPEKPAPLSAAAMFAQVATLTQPRYSPKVPSTTTRSTAPAGGLAVRRRNRAPSTIRSTRITSTLSATAPAWTTRIQAAFSSSEAIVRPAIPRWSCRSHHCHSVYAPSPR